MSNIPTTMTQQRIDKLNSIDFSWTLKNKTSHEQWLQYYFKLYWHHYQYNSTNITTSRGYNSAFVNWVYNQKEKYHAGKLDQGKIGLMDELDFDWELDPPPTWEELFDELSAYHENFGSTLFNKRINKELALWTTELRELYWNGDLNSQWVAKLNSLGFQWGTWDVDWNAMCDRLLAYKNKHNMCAKRVCRRSTIRILGFKHQNCLWLVLE